MQGLCTFKVLFIFVVHSLGIRPELPTNIVIILYHSVVLGLGIGLALIVMVPAEQLLLTIFKTVKLLLKVTHL